MKNYFGRYAILTGDDLGTDDLLSGGGYVEHSETVAHLFAKYEVIRFEPRAKVGAGFDRVVVRVVRAVQ